MSCHKAIVVITGRTHFFQDKIYIYIYSGFKEITSGVPQGSIVGPILFNAFLNDSFYDIENASVYNFADNNTLSCFAKTVKDLIHLLKEESEVAINWFSRNEMIINPDC